MADKVRDELIILEIVQKGTQYEKDAAWKYLRSVSAKAEADIVNVSGIAQQKIISAIGRMRAMQLRNYETQKAKDSIRSILGKMVSDIEVLVRRMITANILAGKVKSIQKTPLKGEILISSLLLNESDRARIDQMTADTIDRIRHGAELTMSSVNAMIQKAAIRSNMPHPELNQKPKEETKQGTKEEKKEAKEIKKEETPVQEPMSREFAGDSIDDKTASVVYREKAPTKAELEQIRKDPVSFVNVFVKTNTKEIQSLRDKFFLSQVKKSNLTSTKPTTKEGFAQNEVKNMVSEMQSEGVFAFTDKGGKRWNLINYCSMTARTTSTTSDNVGDVFADEEHDLYYIVPHSHSCPKCAKVEGKIYSRSGTNPKYPPLASVFPKIDPAGSDSLDNTYMSIHPNCRHQIVKYIEPKRKN